MFTEFGAFVLPAVPLLVLVAFLLLGRFPGEKAIERLSRRLAAARRRPVRGDRDTHRPSSPNAWSPRGGLLIACGMARRPPPALS